MANLIGQTILNQYRVDEFIASGGMGAVYRVTDLKRNCPLAMKVLHADLADDPTVFKRFRREAQALQKLRHPNVVPFYGLFQEKGQTFLLEEFIEGNSLQAILRERNGLPLPVDEVMVYMKGLCAALHYAHTNNIVHCDVKPGNVMVDRQGKIFLTDFGIARFVGTTTTTTLGIAGTPAYMAPEQIVGRGISPVTDIYALGVILFEMLVGQRPFRGTEPETAAGGDTPSDRIRYAHLRLPPPNPRQINPNISPTLAQVVLRALEKNPTARFRSTLEFFTALCQAAQTQPNQVSDETTIIGEFVSAPLPPVAIQRVSNKPSSEPRLQPKQQKLSSSQKNVVVLLLMGVALLVIIGLGIWIFAPTPDPFLTKTPSEVIFQPSEQAPLSVETAVVTARVEFELTLTSQASTTLLPDTPVIPTVTFSPAPPSATEVPSWGIGSTMTSEKDGMTMVFVPEGKFTMGSDNGEADEKPIHQVYLDAYWIDKTEVTNAMYAKCVADSVCKEPTYTNSSTRSSYYGNSEFDDYPVIIVEWTMAKSYCEWRDDRLPTEAEWEKAARGTDSRTYPWGEGIDCSRTNYGEKKRCLGDTTKVGSYESGKSPYGVYDMAGNVWEWVSDWYDVYSGGDSSLKDFGQKYRVVRGGSWGTKGDFLRVAFRGWPDKDFPYGSIGFRCAQSIIP
jgi:serine/threonine-protein kinase